MHFSARFLYAALYAFAILLYSALLYSFTLLCFTLLCFTYSALLTLLYFTPLPSTLLCITFLKPMPGVALWGKDFTFLFF